MLAIATQGENLEVERHKNTVRKQKQMDDAEREHDRLVAEEEADELAERKKQEDKAEQEALELARNSP
jgi:hypothetical protein